MNDDLTAEIGEKIERVMAGVVPEPTLRRQPEAQPLTRRMAALGVPGVSVAVAEGGEIEWAGGFGAREAGFPVTTETMFQAGSISKPTAAVGAMRLVQEGVLDLDEDINTYLRHWKVPANGDWQPRLTLRLLLCHGAGLTVHGFPGYNRRAPLPSVSQILDGEPPANTRPVRVNAIPGTQFRYSGGGTTIVQRAMEDVTGKRFPALMRELVLEPLGMENSTYAQPLPRDRWDQAAAGHRSGGGMVVGKWHVYPEMAAAGLWTTPSDLCRLFLDVQRAWAGEPGTLLRQETVREMLFPQVADTIGIGFFLYGSGPTARFGHDGSDEGFIAQLIAYRETGRGAVVMTNGDAGWVLCSEIVRGIAREYDWPDFPPPLPAPINLPPEDLAPYTGTYQLRPGFHLTVTLSGDTLFLQPDGQPPLRLYPTSPTVFFTDALNTDVEFSRDGEGGVRSLTLRQNDTELEAERL